MRGLPSLPVWVGLEDSSELCDSTDVAEDAVEKELEELLVPVEPLSDDELDVRTLLETLANERVCEWDGVNGISRNAEECCDNPGASARGLGVVGMNGDEWGPGCVVEVSSMR